MSSNSTPPPHLPRPQAAPAAPPPDAVARGVDEQQKKGFEYKPMTFLGMYFNSDEAKKLWQIIIQNISQQISKDQARALAAIKKLNPEKNEDS
jgi:hypothetical protein